MKKTTLEQVPVAEITEGERIREDYGDINELAESIKHHGLVQPIAVGRLAGGGFKLLGGGRRLRAATAAQLVTIPALVFPEDISELEALTIEYVENAHRKDMDHLEEAKAIEQLHQLKVSQHGEKIAKTPDAPGWSGRDTATLLGVSPRKVQNNLEIAEAMEIIPEALSGTKTQHDALKVIKRTKETLCQQRLLEISDNRDNADPTIKRLEASYILRSFDEAASEMPAETYDIIEADPPYGGDAIWDRKGDRTALDALPYKEVSAEDYPQQIADWMKACYRLLKPNGWLLWWFKSNPWYWTVFESLKAAGFELRPTPAVWYKCQTAMQCRHPHRELASSYETFFYARKGEPGVNKAGRENMFTFKGVPSAQRAHPFERPIEMIQEVLTTFGPSCSRVLVPFLGSGNTLLAAKNLGMEACGFEVAKDFRDIFRDRIRRMPRPYKSYTE